MVNEALTSAEVHERAAAPMEKEKTTNVKDRSEDQCKASSELFRDDHHVAIESDGPADTSLEQRLTSTFQKPSCDWKDEIDVLVAFGALSPDDVNGLDKSEREAVLDALLSAEGTSQERSPRSSASSCDHNATPPSLNTSPSTADNPLITSTDNPAGCGGNKLRQKSEAEVEGALKSLSQKASTLKSLPQTLAPQKKVRMKDASTVWRQAGAKAVLVASEHQRAVSKQQVANRQKVVKSAEQNQQKRRGTLQAVKSQFAAFKIPSTWDGVASAPEVGAKVWPELEPMREPAVQHLLWIENRLDGPKMLITTDLEPLDSFEKANRVAMDLHEYQAQMPRFQHDAQARHALVGQYHTEAEQKRFERDEAEREEAECRVSFEALRASYAEAHKTYNDHIVPMAAAVRKEEKVARGQVFTDTQALRAAKQAETRAETALEYAKRDELSAKGSVGAARERVSHAQAMMNTSTGSTDSTNGSSQTIDQSWNRLNPAAPAAMAKAEAGLAITESKFRLATSQADCCAVERGTQQEKVLDTQMLLDYSQRMLTELFKEVADVTATKDRLRQHTIVLEMETNQAYASLRRATWRHSRLYQEYVRMQHRLSNAISQRDDVKSDMEEGEAYIRTEQLRITAARAILEQEANEYALNDLAQHPPPPPLAMPLLSP